MTQPNKKRRLAVDIETDGLYFDLTRLHLLVMQDLDTGEEFVFRESNARDGLRMMAEADLIVGHNALAFDIPALEKLYPDFQTDAQIRDTLILTRLIFSDIKEDDYPLFRKGHLPGKLIGSHSLAAWGYRLGELKGDFGADEGIEAWAEWSQAMEDYCRQDVTVTVKLWNYLQQQIDLLAYSQEAIVLEHRFADLCAQMERNGFPFKVEEARALYAKLNEEREAIRQRMQSTFRPWWRASKWKKAANGKPLKWRESETVTPTKTITYKDPLKAGRIKDAPFCPVELEEFNPGSRDQIADRLQKMFGWKPKEFTETGKPKVSEDILRDLVGELSEEEDGIEESEQELYDRLVRNIPEAKDLADFFLVQKRIGQLAEGKNGWLKLVRDGKVHGSVNTLGAVTRRVTHSKPNMSQCPAARSAYGNEMRSLWHVPEGWLEFGTDLSGIEIRCFADVLAEYDNGAYADIVVNGDVHTENQRIFGVPTRDNAKTTLYALLYGAGDAKIGTIVGQGPEAGRRIKNNFMRGVPAYRQVVNKLNRMVERQGWIPALDGGRLHVRSPHKALNTALQSAGALVAKLWGVKVEEKLIDAGWKHGWNGDFSFLLMAHDEYQIAVRAPTCNPSNYFNETDYAAWTLETTGAKDEDDLKKRVKKHKAKHKQEWYLANSPECRFVASVVKDSIKEVEQHFAFKCPLDCEYIIGLNWSETH